jgi:hypothetical protein
MWRASVALASVSVIVGAAVWWNRSRLKKKTRAPEPVNQFRVLADKSVHWSVCASQNTVLLSPRDSATVEAFFIRNLVPGRANCFPLFGVTHAVDVNGEPFPFKFDASVASRLQPLRLGCSMSREPPLRSDAVLDAILPHFPTLRDRTIQCHGGELDAMRALLDDDVELRHDRLLRVDRVVNSALMDAFEMCRERSLKQVAARSRVNVFEMLRKTGAEFKVRMCMCHV